jgi:peroxiredoxin Q/BCP
VLKVGDVAPDFTAPTNTGAPLTLSTLRGRPLVLFFYPKANTAGCTIETRGFAEMYPEFERANVALIGVSVDSVSTQQEFATRCKAPFPLVSDADKAIARQYGVLGLLGFAKRVTFFLDSAGRVTDIAEGMMPGPHVRRAADHLSGSSPAGPPP